MHGSTMLLIYLIMVYSVMDIHTVSSECAPGSYYETYHHLCLMCLPGTYKTYVGNASCNDCNPGTYSSSYGAISCTYCEAGKYQPDGGTYECQVCGYGKTTYGIGSTSISECVCAPGYYYDRNQCYPCEPGMYKTSAGNKYCDYCHPGNYSSSDGAVSCTECDAGKYQPDSGKSLCQVCEVGKTTIGRGSTSNRQCVCAPGYYYDRNQCYPCEPGMYKTSAGNTYCDYCHPGNYSSSDGAVSCTECEAGKYQPDRGKSWCKVCEVGKTTIGRGSTSNRHCVCAPGYYYDRNQCYPCEPGMYKTSAGNTYCDYCHPGNYSSSDGAVSCTECDAGKYQPDRGKSWCQVCEDGKTTIGRGSTSNRQCVCAPGYYYDRNQCYPCEPGMYKTSAGNTYCDYCQPGNYSSSDGAVSCTECDAGKYQPDSGKSLCQVCEDGKTTIGRGSTSNRQCVCAPGYYYDRNQCYPCKPGMYKTSAGNTYCDYCHPGNYSSSDGSVSCTECEAGKYQPNWGQSLCKVCEVGKTTIGRGSTYNRQCVCSPGRYYKWERLSCPHCEPGTYKTSAGDTTCNDCFPGTYSPSFGATSCTKCEIGRYQPSTRQPSCHTCETGKYQDLEGQSYCNVCGDGRTTLGPGSTSSSQCVLDCEPGKFHADGTDICQDCPRGTYQPSKGQSSCVSCEPGYFQNQMGQNDCVPCQAGSYSDKERAITCMPCTNGTYQYFPNQSSCVPCRIGQYQTSEGQLSCYPCESGKTTNGVGSTSPNDCLTVCSAGTFRSNQGQVCEKCPTGSYQPLTSQTLCLSCEAGTYQNQTGQTSCMQCLPGSYQSSNGSEACIKCSPGFYQPHYGSSSQCLACPFGTYQDLPGDVSCKNCFAGTFQNQTGQMSCIPCPKGSYQSSEGTNKCIACPLGMYQTFVAQSHCLECPPGSYKNEQGSDLCTQCDVGMYQNLSGQISCYTCPDGTNTTGIGTNSIQDCHYLENAVSTGADSKEHNTNLGVIAGSAGGAIVILVVVAIVICIVIRRHRLKETSKHKTSHQDNVLPPPSESQLQTSIQQQIGEIAYPNLVHEEDSKEKCKIGASHESTSKDNTYYNEEETALLPRGAVMLSNLWDYVQEKTLDCSKLSEEFEALPSGLLSPAKAALKPSNCQKNRYKGLYPYDCTRVRLLPLGEDKSDYINASFIDGYSRPKAYIASQGTTKFNLTDFWRMVYQQDVEKIVMLTLLEEGDTIKCLQYWPEEGSQQQYGGIKVTLVHVDMFAEYDIRTLTMTVEKTTKQVTQFHFTAWPDKGVPEAASSIVQFWHKVRNMQSHKRSPTLVHCSAGIGRTGTYIALDYLADQGKDKQYVQIFPCVAKLRRQRVNLIQTEAQYRFLHEALVEALMLSGSAVSAETFPSVYKELLAIDRKQRKTGLLLEFEKLQNESSKAVYQSPGDHDTNDEEDENEAEKEKITVDPQRTSRLEMNKHKNRDSKILPANEYRPCLSFVEGRTDYINAVKLQSHRQQDGLIVTQMPLEDTVIDFWRLVYDFGVRTIVMLNVLSSNTDGIGVYWPDKGASMTEMVFNIENVDENTDTTDYLWRTIRLTKDGEHPREVRQFQCNFWPGSEKVPKQMNAMLKLIEVVEQWQRQAEIKTVVIHCMDGVERSGLYCVLTTVLERLNVERDVAIYQTVKEMKTRRQQIIPNFEQYKYCHDVVLEYLSNFGTYSNFT